MVYGIEPFRAAIRQGEWKLVWQATLPSTVELFNLARDPEVRNNLAALHPQVTARLHQRIQQPAQEATPPLILQEALGSVKPALFGSVVFPADARELQRQP